MSDQDVVEHAQAAILTAVTGIMSAPNYPSDLRIIQPTVITFADRMRFRGVDNRETFFDLHISLMIPRGELSQSMAFLSGIPKLIANIFRADPTIGGHAQTYDGDVTADRAEGKVNNVDCIGWNIVVEKVKLKE